MTLQIVQDEAADEVLSTSAFALLCGMLLRQEVPIEVAFAGPAKILDRFGSLDPAAIATASPDEFAELCAADPAIHPYAESMSVLIQAVAKDIVANYGGETAELWNTAESGKQLLTRLTVLPGFNKSKAQIFLALLGKQLGVSPEGWEEAAGRFAPPDIYLSVADVRDPESLARVQSAKSDRDEDEDAVRPKSAGMSGRNDKSEGSIEVTNEAEETAENTERVGAKKAARKAAKRAARKAAGAGAEPATGGGKAGGARGGAKKAAKKAAKRAARRAAKGLDPEPPGTTGPGRGGKGKKAAAGRNARKRAAAGESGTSDESADDEGSATETE